MKPGIYEGSVSHRRRVRRHHAFVYPIAMPLLDLEHLDEVFARHPLWSIERANAVSFRRADFLGDPTVPLDTAVRDLVESHIGRRPLGHVYLLAHLRTWGWLFNPIALYFCMDQSGQRAEAVVAQVTNTPWHEQHAYVLDGGQGEHRFAKKLHVSPFFGMDQHYRLRMRDTNSALVVHLSNVEKGRIVFDATLSLRRRDISRAALGRLLWRFPLLTVRVSAGIYWQAVRLWLKKAPVHPHPRPAHHEADHDAVDAGPDRRIAGSLSMDRQLATSSASTAPDEALMSGEATLIPADDRA